jgi:hypothetical protein
MKKYLGCKVESSGGMKDAEATAQDNNFEKESPSRL